MSEHRLIDPPASPAARAPAATTADAPATTLPAPTTRALRVGLAGCGVVGGAFARLLLEPASRAGRRRPETELAAVLVRDPLRPREADIRGSVVTERVDEFLAVAVDVVIEAVGGIEPGLGIARAALSRGIPFITANKALVAAHGPELERLARASGATFRFEAAVGGGVPVVRAVREAFPGVAIRRITGILNGTSNYVLSRMAASGASLETALADARSRGYAEADATRDLDGRDAADKIAILAWLAFGVDPARLPVDRRGILPDPQAAVRSASAEGRALRLVAEATATPDGVTATVAPRALPADSELGRTGGVLNRIVIETDGAGEYSFGGPGAGGMATASALMADLIACAS